MKSTASNTDRSNQDPQLLTVSAEFENPLPLPENESAWPPSARPEVFIKQEGGLKRVLAADICYVEALGDYVNVYCVGAGRFTLYATMKEMVLKLPAFHFARVHRKYIARLDRITNIEGDVLRMDVGRSGHPSEIPVGNSYKNALLGRLNIL